MPPAAGTAAPEAPATQNTAAPAAEAAVQNSPAAAAAAALEAAAAAAAAGGAPTVAADTAVPADATAPAGGKQPAAADGGAPRAVAAPGQTDEGAPRAPTEPKSKEDWEREPPTSAVEALLAIEAGAELDLDAAKGYCSPEELARVRAVAAYAKSVQWKLGKRNGKKSGGYALGGTAVAENKGLFDVVEVNFGKPGAFGREGDPDSAVLMGSIAYKDMGGTFHDFDAGSVIRYRADGKVENGAVLAMVQLPARATVAPFVPAGGKITVNKTGALLAKMPVMSVGAELVYVDSAYFVGVLGSVGSAKHTINLMAFDAMAGIAQLVLPCVTGVIGQGRKRAAAAAAPPATTTEGEQRSSKRRRMPVDMGNVDVLGGGAGKPAAASKKRGGRKAGKGSSSSVSNAAAAGAKAAEKAVEAPPYIAAPSVNSVGESNKLRKQLASAVGKVEQARGELKEVRAQAATAKAEAAELRARVLTLERENAVLASERAAAVQGKEEERERGEVQIKAAEGREARGRVDCMEMIKACMHTGGSASMRGPSPPAFGQQPWQQQQQLPWQQQQQQQQQPWAPAQQQQPPLSFSAAASSSAPMSARKPAAPPAVGAPPSQEQLMQLWVNQQNRLV